MAYRFGLLRMDTTPSADSHNESLLGAHTLGIEVTSKPLALRCGLGNIDPQHQENGRSSAIEEALTYLLPPDGSTLVTMRADKDSIGAMAVLHLRLFLLEAQIDKTLVSWIGALDRFGGRQARERFPDLAEYFKHSQEAEAMNVIAVHTTRWSDLESRVRDASRLLTKQMSKVEIAAIASLYKASREMFETEMIGKVAFIEAPGKYALARNWGNTRYDVVVVHDPAVRTPQGNCSRWTLVRRGEGFDLVGFTEEVNAAEARKRGVTVDELSAQGLTWGGNANITSSPNGVGRSSVLSKETVLGIANKHFG